MYTSILAPTDGSEGARQAVDRAIELASLFNADLHMLYVVDTDQFSTDKPAEVTEEMFAEIEKEGRGIVETLEELAYESSVNYVETMVEQGVPHQMVLQYVDDHNIELVVMGTHGEGGHETIRLGTTASKVARRIQPPLLLI